MTPEQRIKRAREAGHAGQRPAAIAKRLITAYNKATEDERAECRDVLTPICDHE